MKRTSHGRASCPIARSLDVIGDWWTLLIVRDTLRGDRRFGELQRSLGVAKNILTTRLHRLVDDGILELVPADDGSAYQQYRLTAKGRDLAPVVRSLRNWGREHLMTPAEARAHELHMAARE
ncbi:MAG TPA: helix-turn-helix domain-containing protein [Candidatus Elarobacter sp.]|jgi:DNA-binding HxlR family transcriptional regulator